MNPINLVKLAFYQVVNLISPVRYARLIGVNIGKSCMVYRSMEWPSEPYLVTIGDNVQLTRGVAIHTHGGGHSVRRIVPDFDVFGKVVIKDWAYIGAHAQIMPGVTIGEGGMVAAGSIVTKSVPAGMVVAGNPARVICSVEDYLNRNQKFNTHTKALSKKEKKNKLLSLPKDAFLQK